MEPRRLTIQGMTRFTKSVTLDLDTLPQGLIAVTGPNGSGKTTIMESMGPGPLLLELPSRPGNLQNLANRRDAYLELVQDYDGKTWRHLVQIDPGTGTSGAKTEAYLWELAPGAELGAPSEPWADGIWIPVKDHPTPGRLGDYHQALTDLGFPPRDVFLAGPFGVHTGSGNFLDLSTAKRRALFVTMLGLGGLQALSDRAKAARQPLDVALTALQELDQELERDRQAATIAKAEVDRLAKLVEAGAEQVALLEADATTKAAALAQAKANLGSLEAARRVVQERKAELEGQRDRQTKRRQELQAQILEDQALEDRAYEITEAAKSLADLTVRRSQLLGERSGHLATRDAAARELHQTRQEVTRLVDARQRLDVEAQELEVVARRAQELHQVPEQLEAALAGLSETQDELGKARGTAVAAETAHRERQGRATNPKTVQAKLDRLERDAGLLEGVPCGGRQALTFGSDEDAEMGDGDRVDCGVCQFLTEARKAAGELPTTRVELGAAEAEAVELARLWAEGQEHRAAVSELDQRRDTLGRSVQELERQAAELTRLQGRLDRRRDQVAQELEANQTRSVDLTATTVPEIEARQTKAVAQVAQVDTEGRKIRQELDELQGADATAQRLALAVARLPERRQLHEDSAEAVVRATTSLAGLDLPPDPVEARQAIPGLKWEHENATKLVSVERGKLDGRREGLGHARGRLAELGDLDTRGEAIEASRSILARRRAGFREIERAMGKTGIQVLEIDAAGPTVAGLCNDLLVATFGGRFAVRLDTTKTGGKGQILETFDLVVLDGNRKGRAQDSSGKGRKIDARSRLVAPVSELSKGERVLVDEALKLAIAMFHAQRSGTKILTLWRDECDTGLDQENRRRYPLMLRRALEVGGFTRIYFVSHEPDVQAQADGVIRVSAAGDVTTELQG